MGWLGLSHYDSKHWQNIGNPRLAPLPMGERERVNEGQMPTSIFANILDDRKSSTAV